MSERDDLVASLQRQRYFLTGTLRDLDIEQISRRPTDSELCLGGLIKHVARAEKQWADFMVCGASAMGANDNPAAMSDWMGEFQVRDGDTVQSILARYDAVARATDELVLSLPDLDAVQPLPQAPWFEPGAAWTMRRVVLHIIAEIAQHSGHADIIRESLDGAKSMG